MVLNSQVCIYVHPSVVREGENVRLVSLELLITNTPEEGCVSDGVQALLPVSWRAVAGEGQ